MKKTFVSFAAVSLMSVAGFASAAEPMQLTETQMDTVAAGTKFVLSSSSGGSAFTTLGFVQSTSESQTSILGQTTGAANQTQGFGLLTGVTSYAGSKFKFKF